MNDSGNVTKNGQQNVDQEISTTSALQEDSQRGQNDGKDNLADITSRESLVGD